VLLQLALLFGTVHDASRLGHLDEVMVRVESHPECIHQTDKFGYYSLHMACRYGHVDVVSYLLDKGININLRNKAKYRCSPSQEACRGGHLSVVNLLLSRGADLIVSVESQYVNTILNFAVDSGSLDLVNHLQFASVSATINDYSNHFQTALDIAVNDDHAQMMETLLAAGADPHASLAVSWALATANTEGVDDVCAKLLRVSKLYEYGYSE